MNIIKILYDVLCDWPNDLDLLYNLTTLHFWVRLLEVDNKHCNNPRFDLCNHFYILYDYVRVIIYL